MLTITPVNTSKVYQFTTPKGGVSKLTGSLQRSLPAKPPSKYPIILAMEDDGLQKGLPRNVAIKFRGKVYQIRHSRLCRNDRSRFATPRGPP